MRMWVKRWIDLAGAVLALVILAPIMAVVALAIRLTMGPPVLFRQARAGYKGRPFLLHKFRVMRDAYDENGRLLPDAKRLTRLGRFLRYTSLDELPQVGSLMVRGCGWRRPISCQAAYRSSLMTTVLK